MIEKKTKMHAIIFQKRSDGIQVTHQLQIE